MSDVFPTEYSQPYPDGSSKAFVTKGLTKRELFAAMAMQSLVSAFKTLRGPGLPKQLAELSVKYADALIAELERKGGAE